MASVIESVIISVVVVIIGSGVVTAVDSVDVIVVVSVTTVVSSVDFENLGRKVVILVVISVSDCGASKGISEFDFPILYTITNANIMAKIEKNIFLFQSKNFIFCWIYTIWLICSWLIYA